MTDYPEHEKLAAINEQSQSIGEFIDWLAFEKDVILGKQDPDSFTGRMYPAREPIGNLLAEFFEIDQEALEAEKRAMLIDIRASQGMEATR